MVIYTFRSLVKGGNSSLVDLKVLLPDRDTLLVSIKKNCTTVDLYKAVVDKVGLSSEVAPYFALFEIVEYGFERRLQPNEFPHNLYIQNYSTATSTCLLIRKWLFTTSREVELSSDSMAEMFFFWQVTRQIHSAKTSCFISYFLSKAVDDVNKGQIKPSNQLYELKALQDSSKKKEVSSAGNRSFKR